MKCSDTACDLVGKYQIVYIDASRTKIYAGAPSVAATVNATGCRSDSYSHK